MAIAWWLRHARALGDPRAPRSAGTAILERARARRLARLRVAAADGVRQRTRPTRERMRAVILHPGGRLALESVPAPPPPGPASAIVRPLAIATCDLDRPMALGATPFPAPLCFGHECAAEVLEVGEHVRTVRPGQRVVVPFQISCGECVACRAGHTANCLAVPPVSMYGFGVLGGHWGGALAERLAVPFADGMLVPLADGIDPVTAASVADNVSDAYRHLGPHLPGLLGRDPTAVVVIVGALSRGTLATASVPMYAGLIAHALGAREVVFGDARGHVRRQAAHLGLHAVTPGELRRHPPSPLVIDASATPAGLCLAIRLTSPDGVCSSMGTLHASARLPVGLMYARNVTVTIARSHARAVIPQVLDLVAAGGLKPERVTTLVAPFDQAPRALGEHMRGHSTKTVITAG